MNLVDHIGIFNDRERKYIMKLLNDNGVRVHEGTLPFVSFRLLQKLFNRKYGSTPRTITKKRVKTDFPFEALMKDPKEPLEPPKYEYYEVEEPNPEYDGMDDLYDKLRHIEVVGCHKFPNVLLE